MGIVTCGIGGGVAFNCEYKRRISGVKKVWLFNLDLLSSPIDPGGEGYVTGIQFTGYDGLYLFDAGKFSHSAVSTPNKNAESGSGTFNQAVTVRMFPTTPTELSTIADLMVADVGAIVLTNNNEFRIYGAENGLSANSEGQVNPTGKNQGEDTATTMTLVGEEKLPYRILFKTDYATTLALVEALVF